MAKRFADTALGRKHWFRTLSPALKCAWRFLCDECDEAGVWSIDEGALEFHVGVFILIDELINEVNRGGELRIARFGKDKLILVGFVAFQYGTLSETCLPHRKVINRLRSLGLDPFLPLVDQFLVNPSENPTKGTERVATTLKEEEEEKDKEEEEEEEGGVGGFSPNAVMTPEPLAPAVPAMRSLDSPIEECIAAWGETLKHYKIQKDPRTDDHAIARLIQRYGAEKALHSIRGQRWEAKTKDFDPKDHLSLVRLLNKPDLAEKLENISRSKPDGFETQVDPNAYAKQLEAERLAFEQQTWGAS